MGTGSDYSTPVSTQLLPPVVPPSRPALTVAVPAPGAAANSNAAAASAAPSGGGSTPGPGGNGWGRSSLLSQGFLGGTSADNLRSSAPVKTPSGGSIVPENVERKWRGGPGLPACSCPADVSPACLCAALHHGQTRIVTTTAANLSNGQHGQFEPVSLFHHRTSSGEGSAAPMSHVAQVAN